MCAVTKAMVLKERVMGGVGWLFILSDVRADDAKTASPSAHAFYT
jgi:hypothetical protein